MASPTDIDLSDVVRRMGEMDLAYIQARKSYEAEIKALKEEVDALRKQIPSDEKRGPRAVEAGGDA